VAFTSFAEAGLHVNHHSAAARNSLCVQKSEVCRMRPGARLPVIIVVALSIVTLTKALQAKAAPRPEKSTGPFAITAANEDAAAATSPPAMPTPPTGESSSREQFSLSPTHGSPPASSNPQKFQWKPALLQTFESSLFFHVWRAAFDPGLRYELAHKPFFHDWFASYGGYNMHRWSDGDSFVVNDVGHPLEGAVFGRIYLQNDPLSFVAIGRNPRYWKSRMKSLAWMAAWSTQFEIGPLSETSFGNQGGFTYLPGCGIYRICLNNPKYPATATNNTGWTDFVVTPLVGLGWVLGEDTIDKYIVAPIAAEHRILGGRVLRSALEPSRSFAALFAGKFPWMLPSQETNFVYHRKPRPIKIPDTNVNSVERWELGTAYTKISLPVISSECLKLCRQSFSGMGFNLDYNLMRGVGIDSTLNFVPAQQGSRAMMQGQFGVKLGQRFSHVGIFGKIRPGFIYYQNALPGGGDFNPTGLTRFSWDFGGIVEYYPRRESNSTFRFDVGTTLVRYLADHTDQRMSEIGSLQSSQYIVNQGNFQISTGYVYRF